MTPDDIKLIAEGLGYEAFINEGLVWKYVTLSKYGKCSHQFIPLAPEHVWAMHLKMHSDNDTESHICEYLEADENDETIVAGYYCQYISSEWVAMGKGPTPEAAVADAYLNFIKGEE